MEGTNNLLVKTYYMLMKYKYGAAPTNTMFFAAHSPYSIIKKYSVLNSLPSASPFNNIYIHNVGAYSGTVGSGTTLQTGMLQVLFLIVSLEFFIDIILLATLWP